MAGYELGFEAFGVTIRLELSTTELAPRLSGILPPGWVACDPSTARAGFALRDTAEGTFDVWVGESRWLANAPLDAALGTLDARMRLHIAANAEEWVFVHAGVVSFGGMALVLPGKSFTGKSTLVAALVRAGADYCSDEFAVFDGEGRIHPYPRRLSIRDPRGGPTVERGVAELGATVPTEAARLGLVALTRYRPEAAWEPARLSLGAGLLALLANTVPARARPQQCMAALGQALAEATVLASDRGAADHVTAPLLEELQLAACRS